MFGHNDDNNQKDEQQVHDGGIVPMHDPTASPAVLQNDTQTSDVPPVPTLSANPISDAPTSGPADPKTASDAVDLLDLKQKALEQLSPLVSHLDQTPEEKFRTTMMMVQASDDKSLLPACYEAAQAITDEKAKAQALLDVVNEINYFTQGS